MRPSCSEALLVVPLLLLIGCATLTVDEERRLGEQVQQEVRAEVVLLRDRVVGDYVARIGAEIVSASGPQPFDYHFYVIEDDTINAFALPAGYIYVHTETILKARNVSEFAGVIAHEVGHVVKRHIAQNYNKQRAASIGHQVLVAGAGVLGGSSAAGAANLGGGLIGMAVLNSFGREAEAEADAFAVEILPRAGYDPSGLVSFFETLRRESGSEPPEFLSNHPTTSRRIEDTSALIAALPAQQGLRIEDGGRLEIIQRRIRLLTGEVGSREY